MNTRLEITFVVAHAVVPRQAWSPRRSSRCSASLQQWQDSEPRRPDRWAVVAALPLTPSMIRAQLSSPAAEIIWRSSASARASLPRRNGRALERPVRPADRLPLWPRHACGLRMKWMESSPFVYRHEAGVIILVPGSCPFVQT